MNSYRQININALRKYQVRNIAFVPSIYINFDDLQYKCYYFVLYDTLKLIQAKQTHY